MATKAELNKLLNQIADRLSGIDMSDLTKAETQIANLLIKSRYLVKSALAPQRVIHTEKRW